MLRLVIDTNIWIRILLGGKISTPVFEALQADKFIPILSEPLLDELREVSQRPRLAKRINQDDANLLFEILELSGEFVILQTVPHRCRDPKDHPVLATAIDGLAQAILSGDDDLRADDELRQAMAEYGVELWGINSFLSAISED